KVYDLTNKESYILIAYVSAVGEKIPLYYIFKIDLTEKALDNDLEPEFKFVKSETAFSSTAYTLN
ncbi:hypothetical protein QBC39DRAFT_248473, partial [Podospora conica]